MDIEIVAHRGYWKHSSEKNTMSAFQRAFEHGFGIETDVRDYHQKLHISHDMPSGKEITFRELLELYLSKYADLPLALNIKSDGLQSVLKQHMPATAEHYYFFDMSVPDLLGYRKHALPFYTRLSEYEPYPSCLEEAKGIWLDNFHGCWLAQNKLDSLNLQHKKICFVSPECHGREHLEEWQQMKAYMLASDSKCGFQICTDFPSAAQEYFNA